MSRGKSAVPVHAKKILLPVEIEYFKIPDLFKLGRSKSLSLNPEITLLPGTAEYIRV